MSINSSGGFLIHRKSILVLMPNVILRLDTVPIIIIKNETRNVGCLLVSDIFFWLSNKTGFFNQIFSRKSQNKNTK